MQKMLDICTVTASKLDLKFNVLKSMLIRIGSRWKFKCTMLYLDMQGLPFVSEIKYLGVYIKAGCKLSCSYDHVKAKFYRCFNGIYSKCKSDSSEVVCVNLLKTYCLPLILYASEAIDPSSKDLRMLNKLIDRSIAKIFNTFDCDIIKDIRMNFALTCVRDTVIKRRENFAKRYRSKNFSFLCVMQRFL
jgi:hypothetical protein